MDKTKLENIILENTKTIFAFFLKKGVDEYNASDLTQDTILAILKASDKIINENAIYGYIFSTANNLYKKYLSSKKKNEFAQLHDEYNAKINLEDTDDEKLNLLRRELAFLSLNYRKCVVLYYFKNNTLKEVAEKLNISLEMAKYYLFKTRKKLKEGMNMNREFGKRSYNPETLYFVNNWFGMYNLDLENLFNRKIVGNILLACYYTPLSLLELAIELGVANVYIEDEVNILLSYKLLVKVENKYQTNWLILTNDFLTDFIRNSKETIINQMCKIYDSIDKIDKIDGMEYDINKNDLKWSLLPLILQQGYDLFDKNYKGKKEFNKLFKSADSISYGTNVDSQSIYQTNMLIGYTPINPNYGVSIIGPNVFPKEYICMDWDGFVKNIEQNLNKYVVISNQDKVDEVFKEIYDISRMMYENLFTIMKDALLTYSPKIIHNTLDGAIYNILSVGIAGIICYQIIDAKILKLPKDKHPITLVYKK